MAEKRQPTSTNGWGTSSTRLPGSTGTTTPTTNTPTPQTPTGTQTTNPPQPVTPYDGQAAIVPGKAVGNGEINIVDAAGQIATDPNLILNDDMKLSNQVPTISEEQAQEGLVSNDAATPNGPTPTANTNTVNDTAQATAPTGTDAAQVETATTQEAVEDAAMEAAQGQLSDGSIIKDSDIPQADIEATANGENALGQALNQSAQQNFTNIIDTSTLAGKLLAEQLGEGNYTDAKATVKGQLDILQGEFVDPATGEPRIPVWAAATARNVSRIASFTGMTGTAATAAMAQALMEASIPIAQADAQFFQTLTIKNLDNRQEATINRANVLSKLELANLDSRTQVAVTNANNFMKMDLANLENEQQARVINTQARVQSILEDAKAENTNRLFMAQSQNEKDMFYDSLAASIEQFNASQMNNMKQFNASELNDTEKFNAELENNREQFYKNMQFQIDTANAKWRQTITLTENAQQFEAAATDVKNKVGISTEMLNQLWDRSDALLDYVWKSAENEADRNNQIALMKLDNAAKKAESNARGTGSLLGTLLGIGGDLLMGAFGF